ncbi:hypothetical protein H2201_009221 [Coniosporium apollinis]|uniref:Uncharacterized protein n=1 Tax=Coniosporium apollinis TaxID=61459 RepID=A0ABQ9NHN2_9PEZI|nr:hypothetical protein H2201_009221 [Coniosporium apollinis]
MLCRSEQYSDAIGIETIGAQLKSDYRVNVDVELSAEADKRKFLNKYNALIDQHGHSRISRVGQQRSTLVMQTPSFETFFLLANADIKRIHDVTAIMTKTIEDKDVQLLQSLLNGDMRPYIKDLVALEE